MRKILVFSHHSPKNADLADLTLVNHWKYSQRHGYDFTVYRDADWPAAKRFLMDGGLQRAGKDHEALFYVGSDVVFTNFAKKIEPLLDPNYGVIFAKEHGPVGHSPVNCGVGIYQNNAAADWFHYQMFKNIPYYKDHPRFHQQVVVDMLALEGNHTATHRSAKFAIKIIEAREMNSQATEGHEGSWQPGDLLVHCYCVDKIESVKKYLEKVQL